MYYILILLSILYELGPEAALIAAAVANHTNHKPCKDFFPWTGRVAATAGCARGTTLQYLLLLKSHGYLEKSGDNWMLTEKYKSLQTGEAIKIPKDIASIHGMVAVQKIIIGYILTYEVHSHADMKVALGLNDAQIRYTVTSLLKKGYIKKVVDGGGRGMCRRFEVTIPGVDIGCADPVSKQSSVRDSKGEKLCEYEDALEDVRMRFSNAADYDIDPDILDAATTGLAKFYSRPPFSINIHGASFCGHDIIDLFADYADPIALQTVTRNIRSVRDRGGYIEDLESYVTTAILTQAHDFAVQMDMPTRKGPHTIPF